MISSNYFKFIGIVDELAGALITVFIIFATVRTCIRLPLSPLYSIAIQTSITFISFILINFNTIIFFLNKFFTVSYSTKGRLRTSKLISDRRRRIVGYGDFSPVTLTGRFLCVLFIILCVTIAATQSKRIKLSTAENTHKIASPLPLKYYETVYMAVTQNTGIKLIIFGGSSTFNTPSYISKWFQLLFNSKHTVLVNDMDANLSPNFNEYIINDDRRAILIGMATLNISKPLGISLSIQLHGSEYKPLMSKSEFEDVFYNRDLKYRMFSSSVYCRGLFYLISSLFHSPTNISRSKVHVEEMCNLFLLTGTSFSIGYLNKILQSNSMKNNLKRIDISRIWKISVHRKEYISDRDSVVK
eukprot:XP_764825.1 hypothetical protein [Theileria parva strain Muguga]